MATIILYNGSNAFTEAVGTPLVSVAHGFSYVNSNLTRTRTFTLRGKLKKTVCTDGFSPLYIKQNTLIQKFSKNFSTFEIRENGITIFLHNYAIVKNVTFDETSYHNLTTFTVEIDCHDYNYANNGILEPSDELSSQINDDGSESITRTISCRAVNTGVEAVQNAKTFLSDTANSSHAGIDSLACQTSRVERLNRLTGDCSLILNYINDPNDRQGAANRGVVSYSFGINQDQGRIEVSVAGTINGGLNATPTVLRAAFNNTNWYNLCSAEYDAFSTDGALSEAPTQYSVTEDFTNNSISFNIGFDNLSNKEAYIIETTSISKDYSTGITCISLKLDFVADYGCKRQRWSKVQALFNTTNFATVLAGKWATYGTGRLASTAKSKSVSYDETNATISTSSTYCTDNAEDCLCLQDFSYSLGFVPPINKYSAAATLNGEGCYYIQDLNYKNRFRFTIQGKYIPSRCCTREESERQLLSRINYLASVYFPASDQIIESKSIEYDEFGTVSFSFGFNGLMSFDIPVAIGDAVGDYLMTEDFSYLLLEDGNRIYLN